MKTIDPALAASRNSRLPSLLGFYRQLRDISHTNSFILPVPTIAYRCVMIQGCMKGIPDATAIILTEEKRAGLEALARPAKTQYRPRLRARIVL
jgi:hypothetical protein